MYSEQISNIFLSGILNLAFIMSIIKICEIKKGVSVGSLKLYIASSIVFIISSFYFLLKGIEVI